MKQWHRGCKCEYHSKNLSQLQDISKKTVPKYKVDILIQKGFLHKEEDLFVMMV